MECNNGEDVAAASTDTIPLLVTMSYAPDKSAIFDELRNIRICLKWCALDHSSPARKLVSYLAFLLFVFIVPASTTLYLSSSKATAGSISFNQLVQLPESALAAISFLTLADFFRHHGLRQLFLLDDALHDDSTSVRNGYTGELNRAFRYLAYILLPAFSVELPHKVIFFATVPLRVPHMWMLAMAATLASWVYRTGVFLLVCVFFRLTCELQILRFEGFFKMFEGEGSEGHGCLIFKEHLRIKRLLLVISHRYRIFIIGCLVTITISQLGALMLVLASKFEKDFCNSGDIVVCSVVQLTGFLMCLLGAARITHRAQNVVSIASRWHMTLTSSTPDTKLDAATSEKKAATAHTNDEPNKSNCDATPNLSEQTSLPPPSPQGASSAFNSRQALVMYLQHNGGGITIFGFALDRGLLHTIFVFEMTLVLWILGKVVVVS
ncbi:uncharacterized protein M6B38_361660 [Iris pallida]|uniref:Gustatory receptor n=1 Tax=Iris pallida TaxID=29817 RepID=A0AAX6GKY1_IRIPA|nr:uncharacterized protein M6B38_361660 [Iris pallida]